MVSETSEPDWHVSSFYHALTTAGIALLGALAVNRHYRCRLASTHNCTSQLFLRAAAPHWHTPASRPPPSAANSCWCVRQCGHDLRVLSRATSASHTFKRAQNPNYVGGHASLAVWLRGGDASRAAGCARTSFAAHVHTKVIPTHTPSQRFH